MIKIKENDYILAGATTLTGSYDILALRFEMGNQPQPIWIKHIHHWYDSIDAIGYGIIYREQNDDFVIVGRYDHPYVNRLSGILTFLHPDGSLKNALHYGGTEDDTFFSVSMSNFIVPESLLISGLSKSFVAPNLSTALLFHLPVNGFHNSILCLFEKWYLYVDNVDTQVFTGCVSTQEIDILDKTATFPVAQTPLKLKQKLERQTQN